MTGVLAVAGTTTPAHAVQVIFVAVGIPLVVLGSIAAIIWAYFRLLAHRADAVAMAEYRKLAEEAVANQQELRAELAKLTEKVAAVEKIMREVG